MELCVHVCFADDREADDLLSSVTDDTMIMIFPRLMRFLNMRGNGKKCNILVHVKLTGCNVRVS